MKELLRELQSSRQRGTNLETSDIHDSYSRGNGPSYVYQQSPSIVEHTIRQNTPGYTPTDPGKWPSVETKMYPQSDLQRSLDKGNNYLS